MTASPETTPTADARPTRGAPEALRALALLIFLGWFIASAVCGGLRWAACNTSNVVRPHKRIRGWPDARDQWHGPYYDALEALRNARLAPESTVAVVLGRAERPGAGHSGTYAFETGYRLYPTAPDLYVPAKAGGYAAFWQVSSPEKIPAIPALWEHDWVLWADPAGWPRPEGYRMVYANRDARLYRKMRVRSEK